MWGRLVHYADRFGVLLITVALILGATGCSAALPPIRITESPIWINSWADLDDIRNDLTATYYLNATLTARTKGWDEVAGPDAHDKEGWWPIGVEFGQFRGSFDGRGYQICDLVIDSKRDEVGLFGYVAWPGSVKNVSVVNVTVRGTKFVGGLVGRNNGDVKSCHCSGSVTGNYCVGGLVGWNDAGGKMEKCYLASTCNVTGHDYVGGLVGRNKGTVSESYCSGRVSGADGVGGLVGFNERGVITEYSHSAGIVEGTKYVGGLAGKNDGEVSCSYSTGNVTGQSSVGGVVGCNYGDTIDSCYSNSTVEGTFSVGGLVGEGMAASKVTDSYSFSRVAGNGTCVGGLVGFGDAGAIVNCSFSTGGVTGKSDVGGLVGRCVVGACVRNSFWDKDTSGADVSSRGTGKTTAEMKDIATFTGAGWSIITVADPVTRNTAYIWNIVDGQTYLFLSWTPQSFTPHGK